MSFTPPRPLRGSTKSANETSRSGLTGLGSASPKRAVSAGEGTLKLYQVRQLYLQAQKNKDRALEATAILQAPIITITSTHTSRIGLLPPLSPSQRRSPTQSASSSSSRDQHQHHQRSRFDPEAYEQYSARSESQDRVRFIDRSSASSSSAAQSEPFDWGESESEGTLMASATSGISLRSMARRLAETSSSATIREGDSPGDVGEATPSAADAGAGAGAVWEPITWTALDEMCEKRFVSSERPRGTTARERAGPCQQLWNTAPVCASSAAPSKRTSAHIRPALASGAGAVAGAGATEGVVGARERKRESGGRDPD